MPRATSTLSRDEKFASAEAIRFNKLMRPNKSLRFYWVTLLSPLSGLLECRLW